MIGIALFVLFIATVLGANWAIVTFGVVPVGFGFMAPAAVFFAGIAFTCRDMLHESLGRIAVIAAILIGAALSWFVEPTFAIASGTAFLVSEFADFSVYSPLRSRGWLRAVAASNVAGLTADSILFLWLAFGSMDFLEGQLLGKIYMTVAAIAALWIARRIGVVSIRKN